MGFAWVKPQGDDGGPPFQAAACGFPFSDHQVLGLRGLRWGPDLKAIQESLSCGLDKQGDFKLYLVCV